MDKAKFPGDTIGYINFASFLIGTAVIDTYQFKLAGAGIYDAHEGTERKMWVRCSESFAVEDLAIGGFATVEAGAIPARVAGPGFDRRGRLDQVCHEWRCH